MKRTTAFLFFCTVLLFASCKKHDYCEIPPKPDGKCDLAQVIESSSYKEDPFSRTRFKKQYDPNTGKVNKVTLGLFQLTLIDSLNLVVKYQGNKVFLLDEWNQTDTVVIATFDNANRLTSIAQGNAPNERLVSAQFSYSSGKLSNISFDFVGKFELNAHYDAYGNVTSLEDPSGTNQGFFYTYDVSVKAKQQFYSDEFLGDAYNTLYLAQFMRWLPDLEPVHKRITSQIRGEDYILYSADLTNHVYDAKGKLISYQTDEFTTFTNLWNCNGK
jgi:hypothetical protein